MDNVCIIIIVQIGEILKAKENQMGFISYHLIITKQRKSFSLQINEHLYHL